MPDEPEPAGELGIDPDELENSEDAAAAVERRRKLREDARDRWNLARIRRESDEARARRPYRP
jgi:hypothetical protein